MNTNTVNTILLVDTNTTNALNDIFNTATQNVKSNAISIPYAIFLIILCFFVYKIANSIFTKYSQHLPLKKGAIYILNKFVNIILIFFAIMIIASAFGINTSSIIALFSVFGLAVSLSVQNTISNVANAISIYFNNPFSINDYIEGPGFEGYIIDVGYTYTTIRTVGKDKVYVPNNTIATSIITNTSDSHERQMEHKIVFPFDVDFDKVKETLLSVINAEQRVIKTLDIEIVICNYLSYGYQVRIRCSATSEDFYPCSFALLENYKKALEKANIKIASVNYIKAEA